MATFNREQFHKDLAEDYIPPAGYPEGLPKGTSGTGRPIRAYHHMKYELSEDITEWISKKAREHGMSDSRYLTMILQEQMAREKRKPSGKRKPGKVVIVRSKPFNGKKKVDEKFIDLDNNDNSAGVW